MSTATAIPPARLPPPPSSTSSPTPPLRSRPSVISFTSLAPSDSRSNPFSTPNPRHRHRLNPASSRSHAASPAQPPSETTLNEHSRLLGARSEELDLLTIDHPDELFQAFTVREVRLLAQRARLDATKKQEDLRQMVGERYRDMLGAADSIVRMKASSLGLLEMLHGSMKLCNKADLKRKATKAGHRHSHSLASSSRITYTLATLVKLLLELSEHIWRSLERDDFLSAARLEALGRIITSELTSGRWDDTGSTEPGAVSETFPVIERQAEVLAQLGPQIAIRARSFLRRWDVGRNETAAALAAVLLLDNTSLLETAALLLQARRSSLDQLLNQKKDAPTESWKEYVRKAIQLVNRTVQQTLDIFGSGATYFVTLLRNIQNAPSSQASLASQRHQRGSSDIELEPIISMLPNAHQSMRYLPASVTSFAPFIPIPLDGRECETILSRENANPDFLAQWCQASREELMRTIRTHLPNVQTTSELAEFRTIIQSTMPDPHLESDIKAELWAHFDALYESRLTELKLATLDAVSRLEPTLGTAKRREWVFSDRLPRIERAGSFERLLASLRARTEGRWGAAESQIVSGLERVGDTLHNDFVKWNGVVESGKEKYVEMGRAFLDSLADGLEHLLRSERTRGGSDVAKEVMVGDIALQIASTERTFITNLGLGQAVLVERIHTRLSQIASRSLEGWTALTTRTALELCTSATPQDKQSKPLDWPSETLYAALDSLAQALASLGPHRLEAERERGLVQKVLEAFISALPSEEDHRSAFDAELIRQLTSNNNGIEETTELVRTFLGRIRRLWFPLLPGDSGSLLTGAAASPKRVAVECVKPGPRFALLAL